MPLNIRDPRAAALAKELSERRQTTMTTVIVEALENEIAREREKRPLAGRLAALAAKARAQAGPNCRDMAREEIDEMWRR